MGIWGYWYFSQLSWFLEKAMATHSSTLAWKIPWTEEPGRLQSLGSLRVRHDWTTSLSLFTFIKRLFSSSLSAMRVVSSAYLWLLIFLPAILTPDCAFSSSAFLMMYSAYELNKQGDNIQPWRTPFPIWNQSVVPCPFLEVVCFSEYKHTHGEIGFTVSQKLLNEDNVMHDTKVSDDWNVSAALI